MTMQQHDISSGKHSSKPLFLFFIAGIAIGIIYISLVSESVAKISFNSLSSSKPGKQKDIVQKDIKFTYYQKLMSPPRSLTNDEVLYEPDIKYSSSETTKNQQGKVPLSNNNRDLNYRLIYSLAKILKGKTPASIENVIQKQLPAVTGSPFAIQISSFNKWMQAEKHRQELILQGHDARIVKNNIDLGTTVYRVRIHGFTTHEEAAKYVLNINKYDQINPLIIKQ